MEQRAGRYSNRAAGPSNRSSSPGPSSPSPSSPYGGSRMPQPRPVPDLHGRAKKKAELNRLMQEIRLLQEELQRLDTLPPASEVCRMLVQFVENQNDPLLSNSSQPQWDNQWDRWFRGPPVPRSSCWCFSSPRI